MTYMQIIDEWKKDWAWKVIIPMDSNSFGFAFVVGHKGHWSRRRGKPSFLLDGQDR
jgi:hypothetical protein